MILAPVVADIQSCSASRAIEAADILMREALQFQNLGRLCQTPLKMFYLASEYRYRYTAYCYLNRACELACVPLAQYYAESSSGALDLVWITYRPEAILDNHGSMPSALVYLDTVDNMTEDQACARALGW